jgi:hypothetical protein
MSKNRVRRFDKNQTKIKGKRRLNKLRSFARALCVLFLTSATIGTHWLGR